MRVVRSCGFPVPGRWRHKTARMSDFRRHEAVLPQETASTDVSHKARHRQIRVCVNRRHRILVPDRAMTTPTREAARGHTDTDEPAKAICPFTHRIETETPTNSKGAKGVESQIRIGNPRFFFALKTFFCVLEARFLELKMPFFFCSAHAGEKKAWRRTKKSKIKAGQIGMKTGGFPSWRHGRV